MELTAHQWIGYSTSREGTDQFQAVDPSTGQPFSPAFVTATEHEVNQSVERAASAFAASSKLSGAQRAAFLEAIATEIEALGDDLIERCSQESGLPAARLTGERGRTCGQLRMFAQLVKEGSWVDARIDLAQPDRQPLPKPDIRRMKRALGPVAVFGASNFPLAFSVAGGDTASAFAAGCPVVVKAHPAHPGTSEMVAGAIVRAARSTGMPDGMFSMVHGGIEPGLMLVRHPKIAAVAFTGSFRGGKALFDEAARRTVPIPVYAEMGSINPVFILPGALSDNPTLAQGLAGSVTMGAGQFCTNPGLVVGLTDLGFETFVSDWAQAVASAEMHAMLTPDIAKGYQAGIDKRKGEGAVRTEAGGDAPSDCHGAGVVFSVDAEAFLHHETLADELFGPSSMAVYCNDLDQMVKVASDLEGQLTATIWHGTGDTDALQRLASTLENKVGRLLFNGFPTGVEVCPSMQHGGPFPATTDSRSTSVGTAAIDRFSRPVAFQNCPQTLLPEELSDENPLGIWRTVDGVLQQ